MKEPSGLTSEQTAKLQEHVAGIGHNQPPVAIEHADEILAHVAKHHRLKDEATRIRVMLDMLRSHITGEHPLPNMTAGYVFIGVILAGSIAGFGIATAPLATILIDTPVVAAIIAALGGEMEDYVDWRAARDPAYVAIKEELYGAK